MTRINIKNSKEKGQKILPFKLDSLNDTVIENRDKN